ncbi:MAG TPA: hypothetical protein VEU11_13780 [Terriglobales bacterium]|nr:hypothetical protein [Terriglobales bacterium]
MFKTVLVEPEISDGRRLVDELRRQDFPITAAFWFYFEEAERWRLVIISPDVQTRGPRDAYRKLVYALAALHQSGNPVHLTTERIHLLGEESLIFKQVKDEVYRNGRTGFVFTQGPVENFELTDAYVYMI